MAEKSKILEVLGGNKTDLLLMEKVRRALQANERVKYLLSLLQLAVTQAHAQSADPDDLSVERRRAGIEDGGLDRVIPSAVLTASGRIEIPAADRIISLAIEETGLMCAPLEIARPAESKALGERLGTIARACAPITGGPTDPPERVRSGRYPAGAPAAEGASPVLHGKPPPSVEDLGVALAPDFVSRLTSADRRGPDSLHLVVMDAHKALNSLMAELGGRRERIGSAEALGLTPEDRKLVEAFVAGIESTAHLKGSHPGLGTTAMRAGTKLLIQNDIGETDAHVVLIEVEDGRIEITYTDVHEKRVEFFTEILGDLGIRWKKTESKSSTQLVEGNFFLLRGIVQANDPARQAVLLGTVGSSLVFLIDWNKARKRLRTFLRGSDVMAVLKWSSLQRVGHMSFISYGDEELIYEVLEALPRGTVRLGEPLSEILGRKGSVEFMKDVLRLCRECYEKKEPRILLVDRLRCQLLARTQKRGGTADEMVLELASLSVEASLAFRDALRTITRPMPGLIGRSHGKISAWEERADDRLNRIRKLHLKEPQPLLPVAEKVDDALDALEDACDLARAVSEGFEPRSLPSELVAMLEEASELALASAQLFLRVFFRYRGLLRGGLGEPLFSMINELKQAEQRGDQIKRTFRWKFLASAEDAKVLLALRELGAALEETLNSLCRGGFLIHDLAYTAMEQRHA
jgi:uncharacterized protein Yka (UPF0111/DUF47 family)